MSPRMKIQLPEVRVMRPSIYHIVRWIAKDPSRHSGGGIWNVSDVNNHINQKLSEGFELFSTHYLGDSGEAYGMMYVLIRRGQGESGGS